MQNGGGGATVEKHQTRWFFALFGAKVRPFGAPPAVSARLCRSCHAHGIRFFRFSVFGNPSGRPNTPLGPPRRRGGLAPNGAALYQFERVYIRTPNGGENLPPNRIVGAHQGCLFW